MPATGDQLMRRPAAGAEHHLWGGRWSREAAAGIAVMLAVNDNTTLCAEYIVTSHVITTANTAHRIIRQQAAYLRLKLIMMKMK